MKNPILTIRQDMRHQLEGKARVRLDINLRKVWPSFFARHEIERALLD